MTTHKPTANSTTTAIVQWLNLNGFKAWRQNNAGIYDIKKEVFRKNPHNLKGVADVIGFNKKSGLFIAIEIKVGRDKLSVEQKKFLGEVAMATGVAMVAHSFDDFLIKFEQQWN